MASYWTIIGYVGTPGNRLNSLIKQTLSLLYSRYAVASYWTVIGYVGIPGIRLNSFIKARVFIVK